GRMQSRAQVLGHPVHQIVVMFPMGAFGFATATDTLHSLTGRQELASAGRLALTFGLATAAVAIPFGLADWLAIRKGTRAKRVGAWHALGNAGVFTLFAAARLLRQGSRVPVSAKILAAAGFTLSGATGWAGSELINRHRVGVHDVIGEDAPSSLSGAP
ncbi:MAG TPA: DUF2231 domain-containing protein, partial [Polyangiaceae bacterium]|nr:DUF2231 domain-containing protein [Polyangiaceae bacterium]